MPGLRFKNELKPLYFGDDNILLDNYLVCVERVFGENEAERHEKDMIEVNSAEIIN